MSDDPTTILLCFDGSPQSEHATAVAGRLFPGARAYVLYVWEPVEHIIARYSVLAPFMGEEVGQADADAAAQADRVAADGVEQAGRAGLDARPHTAELQSTVKDAVLAVAEELDVDVVVTGTRSLHGLRDVIANTLSHHLVQYSPRPVLAIPTPVADGAA